MEKDFRDIGFEGFLREETDRFRLNPSEKVWMGVHQRMHSRSRWPYLLGALALFGLGVFTGSILDGGRREKQGATGMEQATRLGPLAANQDGKQAFSEPAKVVPVVRMDRKNGTGMQRNGTPMARVFPLNKTIIVTEPVQQKSAEPTPLQDAEALVSWDVTPPTEVSTPDAGIGSERPTPLSALGMAEPVSKQLLEVGNWDNRQGRSGGVSTGNTRAGRGTRSMVQIHFSPSISYRKLVGQASKSNFVYSGLPYSANFDIPSDVNDAVTHKPSVGFEIGASVSRSLTPHLRVKAGLQFNINNYEIEAYSYTPELAPLTSNSGSGLSRPISSVSYYRNFFGFSRTWLKNSHFMLSAPIGLELTMPTGRRTSFNLASTIQPTYTLGNNAYLISTNLKNYAQEPSLYRDWNVHAGAEAYLSVSKGSYRWLVGPQIRYQALSSYKDRYPIREHLIDYGMKFGVVKTLR